jgi:hypothetical protein
MTLDTCLDWKQDRRVTGARLWRGAVAVAQGWDLFASRLCLNGFDILSRGMSDKNVMSMIGSSC